MPPPKPRKQLIKAHAAAVKWAENNPESIAAKKNLAYVNSRVADLSFTTKPRPVDVPRPVTLDKRESAPPARVTISPATGREEHTPLGKPKGQRKQLAAAIGAVETDLFGKPGGKPPKKPGMGLGAHLWGEANTSILDYAGRVFGDDKGLSAEEMGEKYGWSPEKISKYKNYEYLKQRLSETGGGLTPRERRWAKNWRKTKLELPDPALEQAQYYHGAPDVSDRRAEAREENLMRGARPTGGPGEKEAAAAEKALKAATKTVDGKKTMDFKAVNKMLQDAGYGRATNKAKLETNLSSYLEEIASGPTATWTAAAIDPFNIARNTKLIGYGNAKKLYGTAVKTAREEDPSFNPMGPEAPAPGEWAEKLMDRMLDRTAFGKRHESSLQWTPWLKPALENAKSLAVSSAMAPQVFIESVYNDVTGRARGSTLKMLKEGGIQWIKDIERATWFSPEALKAFAQGDIKGAYKAQAEDVKEMGGMWYREPFSAALAVIPGYNVATRPFSIALLTRSIARANPGLSKTEVLNYARIESYRPGYLAKVKKIEGGIPERLLTGKVIGEDGKPIMRVDEKGKPVLDEKGRPVPHTFQAPARPPSRTPFGRHVQAVADRISRGGILLPEHRMGAFGETQRAAAALRRGRAMRLENDRVAALQLMEPVVSYVKGARNISEMVRGRYLNTLAEHRTRLAETFYGPQGPRGEDPSKILGAFHDDLKAIREEGGLDIPTDKKIQIDRELRKIERNLANLGLPVDFGKGLWAQAQNAMRQAQLSQPVIDNYLGIAAHRARVWARKKEGRHPQEWLESPEGRNLQAIIFGAPDPQAMQQSLFQVLYPDDLDIPEAANNPYRANRVAEAQQYEEFQAQKARGEIPKNAKFEFDPPYKPQYEVTEASKKRRVEVKAREDLDATTDLSGNMLPDADPERYANVQRHLPREKETRDLTDEDAGEVEVGRTSYEEKRQAAQDFYNTLEKSDQKLLERWYERTWDYVAYLYGEDSMRQMGDAFFASQAAQSPAGGIAMLFRVAEKIAKGEKLDPNAGFITQNVWKLMTGEHLGGDPSGLAAKLMDFMDSGLGLRMRTLMTAEGGPGVVDRWTWRSDGYFPKPGADEGDMVSRKVKGGVEPDTFLGSDRGGAIAYEYSSRRLQQMTRDWNRSGFGGRRDWTVDQVQAIDWFATKKRWVEDGFTPTSAEGGSPLDMALDNTREVAFHGTPEELAALAAEAGAGVRILPGKKALAAKSMAGEFSTSEEGVTHAIIAGAGMSLDRLRMAMGERGQTTMMRYPGSMGGTATQRAHQITIPRSRGQEASAAARRAGLKPDDHPALIPLGADSYRLSFGHGKRARERAEAVADELGIPHDEIEARLTETAGTPKDVLRDFRRMERSIAQTNRAIKERGGKKGPSQIDMERDLATLKERLGIKTRSATDDVILKRAERLVGESRGRAEVLHQTATEGVVRGAVQFLDTDSGRQILYLAEHADESTFWHELFGHASDEMRREYPDEFAAVEKVYGKKYEDWTEKEHERFARENERYAMSGKAPVPELEPYFRRMRTWMYAIYETIKNLGRPLPPETRRLLDRYFGKEPLDFEPPKKLRRTMPSVDDAAAVEALAQETVDILSRGVDTLVTDPKRRQRVAGNIQWMEQQVLPFMDGKYVERVTDKVNEAFALFNEVKSGRSIFTPAQAANLKNYGNLLLHRQREMDHEITRLAAAGNDELKTYARMTMENADDPDVDLEGMERILSDLEDIGWEMDKRTQVDHERERWLSRAVKDLERALDPNRKDVTKAERDRAIGVMHEISAQAEQIYVDVFGENMTPTELDAMLDSLRVRANMLTTRVRELGLLDEGTGDASYVPHRSVFEHLASRIRGPVRLPAAGKGRRDLSLKPRMESDAFGKGANKAIRYQTGEIAATPQALLSAYMSRIRFAQTAMLRKELWEIGVPIPKNGVVPKGWYIVNGTGKAVPSRIQKLREMDQAERDELYAAGEDFDSVISTEDGIVGELENYRKQFLQQEVNGQVPPEWSRRVKQPDGTYKTVLDQMRMVPGDVVERIVPKVFDSAPGGPFAASLGLFSMMGRFATIYAHPVGYAGANIAANTWMLGIASPTSLIRALREFASAPGSMRGSDPGLYDWVASQGGDVLAEAGLPGFYTRRQGTMEHIEAKATELGGRWASFLGDVADRPFRVAAWTGHARRYGFKNKKDWQRLRESTDPELVKLRDEIAQRTRDDMIDFNKLSPAEKRAARFLFIWPFIRGATAWPFHAMSEYPGRIAAMTYMPGAQTAAYEGTGLESVERRYNRMAPASERSAFDLFQIPQPGGGAINMSPISPLGPLYEKMSEAGQVLGGDIKPLGKIWNPAFTELLEGAFGDRGMDWKKMAETTLPGVTYLNALTTPKSRGAQVYTDRDSFWDYVRRRDARFAPEKINWDEVKASGEKEKEKQDKRPAWEKAYDSDMEWYDKIDAKLESQNKFIDDATLAKVKKSIKYTNELDHSEDRMKEKLGKTNLSWMDKVKATEEVFLERFPKATLPPPEQIEALPNKIRGAGDSKEKYRQTLRDLIQKDRSDYMTIGRDLGFDIP